MDYEIREVVIDWNTGGGGDILVRADPRRRVLIVSVSDIPTLWISTKTAGNGIGLAVLPNQVPNLYLPYCLYGELVTQEWTFWTNVAGHILTIELLLTG